MVRGKKRNLSWLKRSKQSKLFTSCHFLTQNNERLGNDNGITKIGRSANYSKHIIHKLTTISDTKKDLQNKIKSYQKQHNHHSEDVYTENILHSQPFTSENKFSLHTSGSVPRNKLSKNLIA